MAEKEYIEREALIDHLKKSGAICGFGKYLIENYPAADVAPVKHGKWKICSDGYYPYCKSCHNEPQNGVMTPYCPNCGAKMDEGGEKNA